MEVSIFTAVMNREDRLKESLDSWLQHDAWMERHGRRGVDEIVIVDWSSDSPVNVDGFDGRPEIRLFRVEGEEDWILSQAFNLAASLSRGKFLLKMDADYKVVDHIFWDSIFPIPEGRYCHGSWKVGGNAKYLNGFMAVRRDDFFRVNGYNERIVTYGWDDTDLYQRLDESLTPIVVEDFIGLYHEPHDDGMRVGNQQIEMTENYWHDNEKSARERPWTTDDGMQEWVLDGGAYVRSGR
jgi:glycosyltransferase involved in cell wall biosynthesis